MMPGISAEMVDTAVGGLPVTPGLAALAAIQVKRTETRHPPGQAVVGAALAERIRADRQPLTVPVPEEALGCLEKALMEPPGIKQVLRTYKTAVAVVDQAEPQEATETDMQTLAEHTHMEAVVTVGHMVAVLGDISLDIPDIGVLVPGESAQCV